MSLLIFSLSSCESNEVKNKKYEENLAQIQEELDDNNLEKVIEIADSAQDIIKDRSDAIVYKAIAYHRLKKYKDSDKAADKAIEIDGDGSIAFKIKAFNAFRLNDKNNAEKYAKQYYKYYPEDNEIVEFLSEYYNRKKDYKEAIVYLDILIDRKDRVVEFLQKRAKSYALLGSSDESISDYQKLLTYEDLGDKRDSIKVSLAEVYIDKKEYRKVIEILDNVDILSKSKYLGIAYEQLIIKDSALYYYKKYLKEVNSQDLSILQKEYIISQSLLIEKNKLDTLLLNIKKEDFKQNKLVNFITVVIVLVIISFFSVLLVIKREKKRKKFDSTTTKYAFDYCKKYFLIGGAWFYLEKESLGIISSSLNLLNVVLVVKLFFTYNLEYRFFFQDITFYLLVFSLLMVVALKSYEVKNIPNIVNELNVKYRKSIDFLNIGKRSDDASVLWNRLESSKQTLDSIFNM